MWIGKKFYTPTGFIKEAITRGISKKINAVPKDFILGEHWIYLAHQEAVQTSKLKESEQNGQKVLNGTKQENGFKSGIFYIFKPKTIDLVIKDGNRIHKKAKKIVDKFGKENTRICVVKPIKDETESEAA